MSREETLTTRLRVAITTASAAVTVAVVVTLGAMSGYLRPPSLEPASEAPALEAASPPAQVVLVPVQQRAAPPPVAAEPAPELVARVDGPAWEDEGSDERRHGDREHRRHRDHDDDEREEEHDD